MKERLKAVLDVEVKADEGGDTIGIRDAIAAAVEGYGRIRFVDTLTSGRLTVRDAGGVRYAGECEYIPCNLQGKCMDGYACEGCALADVLRGTAAEEDALMRR